MLQNNSAATTTELRRNNRNRIFRYIYENKQGVTKQEIAGGLSISLPTVTQNLTELMELNLIDYAGTMESTGGRKPKAIAVLENARIAIGISLSRDHARLLAVNLRSQELAYRKIPLAFSTAPEFGVLLAQRLDCFISENALNRELILGVGITIPGLVDEQTDFVELAPTLQISKTELTIFRRCIPYPTHVENDANAGGFAEWWRTHNTSNLAYLSVEKGVGGAVLLEGFPYRGTNNHSGEFGHMCIEPQGRLCSCGKRGCLEAYCSTDRLSYDFNLTVDEFFTRLEQGDPALRVVWTEYLQHLAAGINNIRMVLDCDIVLGGTLAQYLEPYLPQLWEEIAARNVFQEQTPFLQLSHYRSRANCMGAALQFVVDYLNNI